VVRWAITLHPGSPSEGTPASRFPAHLTRHAVYQPDRGPVHTSDCCGVSDLRESDLNWGGLLAQYARRRRGVGSGSSCPSSTLLQRGAGGADGGGIPLGRAVDGANRHDMKLARQTLESIPTWRAPPRPRARQNLCLDKGYDLDDVRDLAREFSFTAHIRSRGGGQVVQAQRAHAHAPVGRRTTGSTASA